MVDDAAPVRRRRLPNLSAAGYDSIFGWAYVLLMTNVNLLVANAPLVAAVFVVADPLASWPFFLLLGVTALPSLAAAFSVFRDEQEGGAHQPFRSFWRGWRRTLRRSATLGVAAVVLLGFLLVDLLWVGATPAAPIAVPFFATLSVVVVAIAAGSAVAMAMFPDASLRALLSAALYVGVRRWYLSIVAVLCLGALAAIALLQPIMGTLISPALLLFVIWSNTHFALSAAVRDA